MLQINKTIIKGNVVIVLIIKQTYKTEKYFFAKKEKSLFF